MAPRQRKDSRSYKVQIELDADLREALLDLIKSQS
jgi:hypothetical protein